MMTYLTGRVSTPGLAMARHLMQLTLPPDLKEVAAYYGWAHDLPGAGPDRAPAPRLRADLDPRLARLLGLDPAAPLDLTAVANLLSGHRADGRPIPGKQLQAGERVTFIDLCFSADKSVSTAWALAPTEAERAGDRARCSGRSPDDDGRRRRPTNWPGAPRQGRSWRFRGWRDRVVGVRPLDQPTNPGRCRGRPAAYTLSDHESRSDP